MDVTTRTAVSSYPKATNGDRLGEHVKKKYNQYGLEIRPETEKNETGANSTFKHNAVEGDDGDGRPSENRDK